MSDEERVAQVVAEGSGCTGGCRNRPCEVDYRFAREILAAMGPQLTAEEAEVARLALDPPEGSEGEARDVFPSLAKRTAAKLSLIAKA